MSENVKSAVVLFVKNEVTDILSWISWHFAIGFDKLYIYDDHSDDGTYEVCDAAKKKFNIELKKTNIIEQANFFWRQKDAYVDACKKASGEFDWLAFIDADEYIVIENDKNINDFLSNFSNANAIALNWKIYGSSNRVIKDHVPIFESFICHSDKTLNDNRLVKSIIRPEKYNGHYTDPHRYYMNDEVYVDALGENVVWEGSTKNIVWENAWVNHYICRSMEHYVNRIKRRIDSDLYNSINYWNHFNRNDIQFHLKKDIIDKANKIRIEICDLVVRQYIYKNRIEKKYLTLGNDNENCDYKLYFVKTFHDKFLCVDSDDGYVCQRHDISAESFPVYALVYKNCPDKVYLFKIKNDTVSNISFYIKYDNRKSYCYSYDIEQSLSGKFFLKHNKYLSFCSSDANFSVECNRTEPSSWEEIELIECGITLEIKYPSFSVRDATSFSNFVNSSEDFSYNDFLISFSNLNKNEKESIIENNGKMLKSIV